MDSSFGNQVGAVDLSLFDPLSSSAAASYPLTAPTSPKTRPPEQLSNLQPQSNAPHCSQSSPAPSEQPVTTEHCPILKFSIRSDPLALNHPTLPQHSSLKSVYIAPTPTLPHQPPSPNPALLPKIIINSAPTKLIFDSENVDYFFQRFESLHRCWKPNTKCPAERTRPSLSKTHNPELKSNVSLLHNLQKSKSGRTVYE